MKRYHYKFGNRKCVAYMKPVGAEASLSWYCKFFSHHLYKAYKGKYGPVEPVAFRKAA